MSLRLRVSVLVVILVVPALATLGTVTYMRMEDRVEDDADELLLAHLASLQPILSAVSGERSIAGGTAILGPQPELLAISIFDTAGDERYASAEGVRLPAPGEIGARSGEAVDWEGQDGESDLRVAFAPVLSGNGDLEGYVVAGLSLEPTHQTLENLREALLFGGAALLAGVGLATYALAGLSLRPVRDVSALAADVERTGDFTRRLRNLRGRGELAELTRNVNGLVEAAERSVASQRGFVAYSSHELQRPLTVIRTYVDVLDSDVAETDRLLSLHEIRLEVDALSRLVSDLMLVSRDDRRTLELREVDLMPLCARLFERWREWDGMHSHGFSGADEAIVFGDPAYLERMISNLLENASQNTPAGGILGLRVEMEGRSVRVSVSDSGYGIPKDEQPRIFQRYFRGAIARQTRSEGAGLGLSIVQLIAESHGGQVGFVSEAGKGSTFVVELPLAG